VIMLTLWLQMIASRRPRCRRQAARMLHQDGSDCIGHHKVVKQSYGARSNHRKAMRNFPMRLRESSLGCFLYLVFFCQRGQQNAAIQRG
jgi:hypothetical protein